MKAFFAGWIEVLIFRNTTASFGQPTLPFSVHFNIVVLYHGSKMSFPQSYIMRHFSISSLVSFPFVDVTLFFLNDFVDVTV